jgi:hypothetical protein
MPRKLTATLAVRIDPEADRLCRELEQTVELPANRIVEEALRSLKADLDRRHPSEMAA